MIDKLKDLVMSLVALVKAIVDVVVKAAKVVAQAVIMLKDLIFKKKGE